ncbi:hypothetical protein FE257_000961 [Aspergillus nanangensis]|uniref:Uncharacterized protein n=1 Tax=Aspergillus nanangensis TaxID=2582783 RepID=A0AAD4GP65_ASPNN|nr:hypothetical protein FE257_000961 [Aspergillus nanangensis]
MSLLQLPEELLCHIGDYLACYRDVRALVVCNRRLNRIFKAIPLSRLPDCHGSLLVCAAHNGNIGLVQEILSALNVKRNRNDTASVANADEDSIDEEEERSRDTGGRLPSDLVDHTLYEKGYRVRDILNIQRAFLAAISTGLIELVRCFFNFGATATFEFPRHEQYPEDPSQIYVSAHFARLPDPKYPPPLCLALKHGDDALFDLLMKYDSDPCAWKRCPLFEAVTAQRFHAVHDREMFDFMVESGVDIERYGHLALHQAICNGSKEWVEFLISEEL